jgi:hypothetical protein
MVLLRREISDYSRSCEHLIAALVATKGVPFTLDEIDWIRYYTVEMTNLVDQLLSKSRPQARHRRETIRLYAVACEAMMLMEGLSDEEKASIRQSILDIRTKILVEDDNPAPEC